MTADELKAYAEARYPGLPWKVSGYDGTSLAAAERVLVWIKSAVGYAAVEPELVEYAAGPWGPPHIVPSLDEALDLHYLEYVQAKLRGEIE